MWRGKGGVGFRLLNYQPTCNLFLFWMKGNQALRLVIELSQTYMSYDSWTSQAEEYVHGSGFYTWPPNKERHSDIEVIRHGLPLDQSELPDVVPVVSGVDDVRVLQLPGVHQHVIQLQHSQRQVRSSCAGLRQQQRGSDSPQPFPHYF